MTSSAATHPGSSPRKGRGAPSLGENIRRGRKVRGLTQVALAELVGCSSSYISQVERDLVEPSISSLKKIAAALQVPMAEFFADGPRAAEVPGKRVIVRANERKVLQFPRSSIRHEMLCPDLTGSIELLWDVIPPGAGSGEQPYVHEGEECGVILHGRMELRLGEEVYYLTDGDSFYCSSTIPHAWRNPGDTDLELIVAITPPSF